MNIYIDPVNVNRYLEFGRNNPAVSAVIAVLTVVIIIIAFSIIGSDKR